MKNEFIKYHLKKALEESKPLSFLQKRALEEVIKKGEKNMKIFISQPMFGRTEEEVLKERKEICKMFNISDDELIDSYEKDYEQFKNCKYINVGYLGDSIMLLSNADLVIFAPYWRSARGCQIEYKICEEYDIPYICLKD